MCICPKMSGFSFKKFVVASLSSSQRNQSTSGAYNSRLRLQSSRKKSLFKPCPNLDIRELTPTSGHRRTPFTAVTLWSYWHANSFSGALSVNVWAYLHVEDVMVCSHPRGRAGAAAAALPASIKVTRDDVCDTAGEEGSWRKQGCGSLIIVADTWTHTPTRICFHTHMKLCGSVLSLQLE